MGSPEEPERHGWRLATVLTLLLFLYLAAFGPLRGLSERRMISDANWNLLCDTVYAPIVKLEEKTSFFDTPVGEAYFDYLALFEI